MCWQNWTHLNWTKFGQSPGLLLEWALCDRDCFREQGLSCGIRSLDYLRDTTTGPPTESWTRHFHCFLPWLVIAVDEHWSCVLRLVGHLGCETCGIAIVVGCSWSFCPHSWHIEFSSKMLRCGIICSSKWSWVWDSSGLFSLLRKSFLSPLGKFALRRRSFLLNSASRWKTFRWLLMSARNAEPFGDGVSGGWISDSFNSPLYFQATMFVD